MKQKLKVDLHTHTAEDPKDYIDYNAFELIDRASEQNFDVLAITNHNAVTYNKELEKYAEKRDILLVPGIEATLSKKHVLIINPDFKKTPQDTTLEDLARMKNDGNLIIAPHPFFPGFKSLNSELYTYLSIFDAIEFCSCYNHMINLNKKAMITATDYHKPLIGSSDCHNIWQFGKTYSLVEARKDISSLIEAIKMGKIEVKTSPLSLATMCRLAMNFILTDRLKIPLKF
jgi:hypothetical protein